MKRRLKKAGLKLNIQNSKIKASSPITSGQADKEKIKIVTDFILGGSKITADGYCIHEIKRCLLLGRKAMTKLHNILKSRHHFANKGPYSQSYGISSSHVQMWELDHKEGQALKNWFSRTVVLKKTLESPSDNKEINPRGKSILNIHWKDWCWSSNTFASWCEEWTHWKRLWCWERLKAREVGDREWDGWMASSTQWTWIWANSRR